MVRRFIILSLLIISIQGCNHENMEKLDNIYPGEVLREEFMMPLEITVYRLSKDLGIPKRDIQLDLSGGWMDTDGWYAGLGVSFRKK